MPSVRRAGLTLIEVLVAAVILSVAALAALELLASTDAASLAARRIALASIEAERALAQAATAVREGRDAGVQRTIDASSSGEALASCTVRVRTTNEVCNFTGGGGESEHLPVVRLIAEVSDPQGNTLAALERVAALPRGRTAP